MDPIDRRRHPRYSLDLPVFVSEDGMPPVASRLSDISKSGLLITSTTRQIEERTVLLTMRLRGRENAPCSAVGKIIRKPNAGVAVEFEQTNQAFRDFIDDLQSMRADLMQDFIESVIDPRLELK